MNEQGFFSGSQLSFDECIYIARILAAEHNIIFDPDTYKAYKRDCNDISKFIVHTECGTFEVLNAIDQATQLYMDISNTPVSKKICDGSEDASYPTWAPDAAGTELLLKPVNGHQRRM